jgi:hypothetical protein
VSSGTIWVLVGALMISVGCATTSQPVEKSVTDFRQVAGSWTGSKSGAEGTFFRANLLIRPDGQYRLAWERARFSESRLVLEGGTVRFGHGSGSWMGKLTLVEERGAEYLRFVLDSGDLWMEFERAP